MHIWDRFGGVDIGRMGHIIGSCFHMLTYDQNQTILRDTNFGHEETYMKAEQDNQQKDTRFNIEEQVALILQKAVQKSWSNVIPKYGFGVAMDQQRICKFLIVHE